MPSNLKNTYSFKSGVISKMFRLDQLEFGRAPDGYSSCKGFESGGGKIERQTHGAEVWGKLGDKNAVCSDFGFYQERTATEGLFLSNYRQTELVKVFSDFESLDNSYSDIVFPSTRSASIQSEITDTTEPQNEAPSPYPLASLDLLKNFESRFQRLPDGKVYQPRHNSACTGANVQMLSTLEIIKLAGENFIQSSSQQIDNFSVLCHPYANSFACLSVEETRDIELIQYLLASAEKVGQQQFVRANKLLCQCEELSSAVGNPIQRLVYYFSEALRERIDLETGRITSNSLGKKQIFDCEEAMVKCAPSVIAFHQKVPFFQVCQFAGVQAIVENVAEARKIHIIDLEIRNGVQCTVIMQALAARYECPVEHLKITAIRTTSKPTIEETGKRLSEFALSMNVTFSFHVVMVSDMLDLNEDLFELDSEEAVAVYSPYLLWNLISQPGQLECLMRVIRSINPCVMVVTEIEANINSPIFVNRFTEALFYNGAFFDALEVCMGRNDQNRLSNESIYFRQAIRNTVAAEGEERLMRRVSINVWRAFFARYGMVEIELSTPSLYQAGLVVNDFACGSHCTLDKDGKCLTIGWKGTPLFSLSAWTFHVDK